MYNNLLIKGVIEIMKTAVIKYNPQNLIVSSCLEFLSTLKGVKISLRYARKIQK